MEVAPILQHSELRTGRDTYHFQEGWPNENRKLSTSLVNLNPMQNHGMYPLQTHQSSFRKAQHSLRLPTWTQQITTVSDFMQTIEDKAQCDITLLDFSKAFDRVSHRLYWPHCNIMAYMDKFCQIELKEVVVEGVSSERCKVTSGLSKRCARTTSSPPVLTTSFPNSYTKHPQTYGFPRCLSPIPSSKLYIRLWTVSTGHQWPIGTRERETGKWVSTHRNELLSPITLKKKPICTKWELTS